MQGLTGTETNKILTPFELIDHLIFFCYGHQDGNCEQEYKSRLYITRQGAGFYCERAIGG